MTLWDKIVRGSVWSAGPTDADIARFLVHSDTCPLCLRHGCADLDTDDLDRP